MLNLPAAALLVAIFCCCFGEEVCSSSNGQVNRFTMKPSGEDGPSLEVVVDLFESLFIKSRDRWSLMEAS